MNQFLQNNLITIIVFLLLLIFVLMGAMILMLFKLVSQPKKLEVPSNDFSPRPKLKLINKSNISLNLVEAHYCSNHKELPSVGSCLMCEEVFCDNCLIDHDSMHFCKDHFRVFANHKWKQITDIKTTPDTPEDGLFIYNFKRDQWLNNQVPSFIMTHYKINIENDFIESFIQLNVKEEDAEKLFDELSKYKALD